MNILQIYPKADFFTGAAMQLRDLAAGLASRGHRVVVATRPSARCPCDRASTSDPRGPWPA